MKSLLRWLTVPIIGLSLGLSGGLVHAAPAAPAATPTNSNAQSICEGVGLVGGGSDCSAGDPTKKVGGIVGTIINLLSIVVGVVAVIMIIIGGFKYVISSGDSNNINSAKNTILYAIVGLIVVAFAQIIVRYVVDKAK